jgi:hypothetical protein
MVLRILRPRPNVAIHKSLQHNATIGIAHTRGTNIHGSVLWKAKHSHTKGGPEHQSTISTGNAKTRKLHWLKIEILQVRKGRGSNDWGLAGRFGGDLWYRHWGECHWHEDWWRWLLDWGCSRWDGSGSRGHDRRSIHVGGDRVGSQSWNLHVGGYRVGSHGRSYQWCG